MYNRITDGVVTFATWKNMGEGKFQRLSDMSTSLFCNPAGIWFVDLNGMYSLVNSISLHEYADRYL
jgi:hypothetical protein